jgi:hypothetical protein
MSQKQDLVQTFQERVGNFNVTQGALDKATRYLELAMLINPTKNEVFELESLDLEADDSQELGFLRNQLVVLLAENSGLQRTA